MPDRNGAGRSPEDRSEESGLSSDCLVSPLWYYVPPFPPLRGGTIKPTHMSFRAQRSGVEKSPCTMCPAVNGEYVPRHHASLKSDSLMSDSLPSQTSNLLPPFGTAYHLSLPQAGGTIKLLKPQTSNLKFQTSSRLRSLSRKSSALTFLYPLSRWV